MRPPEAAAAERDVLLATKLHAPRPHPGFLPRPRLLERLAGGMAQELTLVCAPAGFGKTALLADWARRARGRLSAALRTYEQALEIASEAGRPLPPAGMAHVGMAEVLYERGELAAALDHATEGVRLCRQLAYTLALLAGLAVLAGIRQAQGDVSGVLEAITEAERVQLDPAVVGLLNPVPALRARLALAHGEVADAAGWAQARGLAADDQPSYPREREYLVLARVLLAEQAPTRALGLLGRLHDLAAAQGRTGSVIEVGVLRALALAARGDEAGALAALAEALALAAPEGYTRVFLDEGAPLASLLDRLAAAGRWDQVAADTSMPAAYLRQLREAFRPAAAVARVAGRRELAGSVPGLVEPLSERELEVLGLLAVGRSNREIAEELVVALDTVKKHVGHVLDKLGAANRTQAVARARKFGLLG